MLEGQEVRSGGFVAKTLLGGNTLWTSLDTFGCTTSRLHDQKGRLCEGKVSLKIFFWPQVRHGYGLRGVRVGEASHQGPDDIELCDSGL